MVAAGLGEEVLEENEAAEARLRQLRQRRVDQVNLHVKSTTSGATARDVQLLACRLANRLCATLDDETGVGGGGKAGIKSGGVGGGGGGGELGSKTAVAVDLASAGGVDAVALIFRLFEALDSQLMVEALQFALVLACACAAVVTEEESSSETSSLASSSSRALAAADERSEPSPLLPLLRPLYAPSSCKRVSEVARRFPHSRKTQSLCCLLVGQLGSACGAPARRCFADCCEPIVAAASGSLEERNASDSDWSSVGGGDGGGKGVFSRGRDPPSPRVGGVRDVACQALAVLAHEPGLSRRLVTAGAGPAVTHAMGAAPRSYDVQLSCLETIAMLAESNHGMWDDDAPTGGSAGAAPAVIDAPCRRAVQSIQTFARDPGIHRAASRAILALLVGDAAGNAARSVAAAGGATALSRVLATSPTNGEVQLPAVLAINELLERYGGGRSGEKEDARLTGHDQGSEALTAVSAETKAVETVVPAVEATQTVEGELIAAAGCELLCKSAKTFPRDRELRLGCMRAMGALCRGAPEAAVDRLVEAGVCEQVSTWRQRRLFIGLRRSSGAWTLGQL